jgi:2-polyprenyl-3-methyl-5-hydroxy-6-metoxy-1,4-benzoquinol methylase
LIYQNPRPSLAEMPAHYPAEYESYANPSDERDAPPLLQQAYRYGMDKRRRFITRAKSGGSLLDVGCATGIFLRSMGSLPGWEVQGVEISPHAAAIARQQGLRVFTGTLEEAHFPAASFDAVTLWDVFEHLHDPASSLTEIRRVLKPDGLLVLRVPNVGSWDARIFGRYWAGYDSPRHLYVFDRRTLAEMLARSGFEIVSASCGIGSYPTFVLSLRFWLRARGTPPVRQQQVARFLYHPLMRLLTAPLFYLYGLGLRGPLLVVSTRPVAGMHERNNEVPQQ